MLEHKLRFRELFKLSLRTLKVKPVRTIFTVAGMSVGIGTVIFLVSLGYGLQYILIGKLVTTEDSLITMEISYPTETNLVITKNDVEELKKIPEVAEISPLYEFPGETNIEGGSGLLIDTRIVEPNYFRLSGLIPDFGTAISSGKRGVIVSSQALIALDLPINENALGKTLFLKIFYQDSKTGISSTAISDEAFPILGIITDETMPPTAITFPEHFSEKPPFSRTILVKSKNADTLEKLRDIMFNYGFLVSARIDLVNQARQIMNIITIVLGIFGVTALFVSAIGMFNTMIVGFMERTYEVGILKSIGATDTDVRNLFLMESTLMGLFGGIGGIILGITGGALSNSILNLIAEKLGGKAFELFITPPWFILFVIILSIFIGLASGFWPSRRAAILSPKEAFMKR
jgi:putative ABC transport system permease protein